MCGHGRKASGKKDLSASPRTSLRAFLLFLSIYFLNVIVGRLSQRLEVANALRPLLCASKQSLTAAVSLCGDRHRHVGPERTAGRWPRPVDRASRCTHTHTTSPVSLFLVPWWRPFGHDGRPPKPFTADCDRHAGPPAPRPMTSERASAPPQRRSAGGDGSKCARAPATVESARSRQPKICEKSKKTDKTNN